MKKKQKKSKKKPAPHLCVRAIFNVPAVAHRATLALAEAIKSRRRPKTSLRANVVCELLEHGHSVGVYPVAPGDVEILQALHPSHLNVFVDK